MVKGRSEVMDNITDYSAPAEDRHVVKEDAPSVQVSTISVALVFMLDAIGVRSEEGTYLRVQR
jgi:hypothetical protein